MADKDDKIKELFEKLALVIERQTVFSNEVAELKAEIARLKADKTLSKEQASPVYSKEDLVPSKGQEGSKDTLSSGPPPRRPRAKKPVRAPSKPFFRLPKLNIDLEKFIGENLINKIGILITVIGVAIGAKYTIEHDLISPLTRIILGYLTGIGLLGFGMKLKKNYHNFSGVLVSGAMAIMYFITYAAHSFYGFFSQEIAFALMAIFTVFTVLAALNYDKQIIAHIGLVGAYAVPFLLSDDTGQALILFSYVAIINIGIMFIAFKKYWKLLYYAAFVMTWLIFASWYMFDYERSEHYSLALIFLSIFFITFYVLFLAFKLIQQKKFVKSDIILLITNSFIFYGIGYSILDDHETGKELLGLFTLANGIIHFIVSTIIYRQKLADRNLFYMVAGLVLVFITMAVPVQLDGNWVTLFWAGEAALLFWIGRSRQVSFYEKLSYPLMFLALISLLDDWDAARNFYDPDGELSKQTPLFNINFLSAALVALAFVFINYFHLNKKYPSFLDQEKGIWKVMKICIPAILAIVLYGAFKVEIEAYWDQLFQDSKLAINGENATYKNYRYNEDLQKFKSIWVLNYSMLFCTILSFVNLKKLKLQQLGFANLLLNTFFILSFLSLGLLLISELRESYLQPTEYYQHGIFNLIIRYVSYFFIAGLLYACFLYSRAEFMKYNLKMFFGILLHLAILWMTSSELLHWMDMADSSQSYKLGLSIHWGIYALILVSIGIWKQRKYLRIGGIILFAITLVKLFVYDISHLDTIAKTVVFVSLGVLLLIISFLYNKYSGAMDEERE